MSETFYRVHWDDCPEFSAENAWSALWGRVRSEDGSATECPCCDGEGRDCPCGGECDNCDGEGWHDAVRGYSCTRDPQELIDYFAERGDAVPDDETVIVFTGVQVGTGFDGEPTAIPEDVLETMTWTEFVARTGH